MRSSSKIMIKSINRNINRSSITMTRTRSKLTIFYSGGVLFSQLDRGEGEDGGDPLNRSSFGLVEKWRKIERPLGPTRLWLGYNGLRYGPDQVIAKSP